MMPTDQDRDSLARIIFTATRPAGWQAWEQTSDGMRAWCRAKADEAMAAGWRKMGAEQVVVDRDDVEKAKSAVTIAEYEDPSGEWEALGERLEAALADPAGANGG